MCLHDVALQRAGEPELLIAQRAVDVAGSVVSEGNAVYHFYHIARLTNTSTINSISLTILIHPLLPLLRLPRQITFQIVRYYLHQMEPEIFLVGMSSFLMRQNSSPTVEGLIAVVHGADVILHVRMNGHHVIAKRDCIVGCNRAEGAG